MNGWPVKTTPVELALYALVLGAALPVSAQDSAQDSGLPDAALLEFLAEWDGTDSEWLDAELNSEQTEAVDDGAVPTHRVEKTHE